MKIKFQNVVAINQVLTAVPSMKFCKKFKMSNSLRIVFESREHAKPLIRHRFGYLCLHLLHLTLQSLERVASASGS